MKMYVFTATFWQDASSRIIRTFCQTLASVMGGTAMNIWSASWKASVGVALGASFVSFLMCLDRAFALSEVKITNTTQNKKDTEAP